MRTTLSTYSLLIPITLITCLLSACNTPKPAKSTEVAVKGLYSSSMSDNGEYAIIGSITHGGSLWRLSDMERMYNWNHQSKQAAKNNDGPSETNIIASDFSPEGRFALTADHQTMVLWNVENGQALTYWTAPAEVLSIALTPEGNQALLGLSNHQAVLYEAKTGGIRLRLNHTNRVRSVDISADGRWAVTGSEDETAVLWNVKTGKPIHTYQHSDDVQLVKMSRDASRILSVSKYDKAVLWRGSDGKTIGEIKLRETPLGDFATKRGLTITTAAFSEDGSLLVTGNSDRLVQLWNTNTLKEIGRWELPKRNPWKPTSAAVLSLSFGPPKTIYAAASNGYINKIRY